MKGKHLLNKAKIIFVDFNFSWPPNGGADVDTYNVLNHLYKKQYNVLFIGIAEEHSSDRGKFNPPDLTFPSIRIPIPFQYWNAKHISNTINSQVQLNTPSLIFLQHGYHIKILVSKYLMDSFPNIPIISKVFAHELFCLRNPLRFKNGHPCPKSIFTTPNYCRKCSLEGQKKELLSGNYNSWTKDYIKSKTFSCHFIKNYLDIIKKYKKVIVYNKDLQAELLKQGVDAIVIPGGIEKEFINEPSQSSSTKNNEKIILMAGRCDDPSKGMNILYEAGKLLSQKRNDFKIYTTSFNLGLYNDWFIPLGWLTREELLRIYSQADICVVPSIWAEPFGIIVLEAMSKGKAVVASNIGGLKEIIKDNETGILFKAENYSELSEILNTLLDNPQSRTKLGSNAQQYVLQNYTWDTIVDNYYIPLIQEVLSKEK